MALQLFQHPVLPRLFSLENFNVGSNAQPSELIHLNPPRKFYFFFAEDYDAIVVFVDGACRGNGTPYAKGGYGVYFGPESPYNVSKPLKENSPQTSQRAELTAVLVALNQIERVVHDYQDYPYLFIIATDSAYLVNSLTSYIYKWRQNNYTASSGKQVVNRDLFERLDSKLNVMANGRQCIDVLFWKVDRSENVEADKLAGWGAR